MKFEKVAIKKDDKVKVITGKDKGKIGKVLKVLRKKDRILIEKVNIIKRHTRPSAKNRQAMHTATEDMTDSMRMYLWGVDGGRPKPGEAGLGAIIRSIQAPEYS